MKPSLLNITVPVYNEAAILQQSISRLVSFLHTDVALPHEIVIVDNASTDSTLETAKRIARRFSSVRVMHLEQKGRGRAIKRAWFDSKAEVLTYMDVDLSTDLAAFPILIESLCSGDSDLAIGSRLLAGSTVRRGYKRELISRSYNLLVKACLQTHFSDAQCGFKAITRRAAHDLLPLVENNNWFMDTELLVLAEKLGYRIRDVAVHWVDDPDSRVVIWRTILEDLVGLLRMRWKLQGMKNLRQPR